MTQCAHHSYVCVCFATKRDDLFIEAVRLYILGVFINRRKAVFINIIQGKPGQWKTRKQSGSIIRARIHCQNM